MRLFFGIPIKDSLRDGIVAVQERLRPVAGKVKWVVASNFHLTLRFLGEVAEGDVDRVAEAGEGCWLGCATERLRLGGVGAFPNPRRPRVIWVGTREGEELVRRLHEALNDRLEAKLDMERERRRFSPHLTIGRVKEPPKGDDLARTIRELADEGFGSFPIGSFALYESTLTRSGPVYRVVRRYAAPGTT